MTSVYNEIERVKRTKTRHSVGTRLKRLKGKQKKKKKKKEKEKGRNTL